MTDKKISDILNAGEILQNTLDPEGILSNGKTSRIIHRLTEDGLGFNWKIEIIFPNNDSIALYGQYHENIGYFINRCIFTHDDEKQDVPLKPSETIIEAFGELTKLPGCLKGNLVRISPKTGENKEGETSYGLKNYLSAADAVFWEMEGGEEGSPERIKFKEITIITKKDSDGFFTKNTVIATCYNSHSIIRARVTVDMYGLSSQAVTLEREFEDKDEISAYCYTENYTGRKVPSLKLAFKLDRLLSNNDNIHQRKIENKIEMPSINTDNETSIKTNIAPPKNKSQENTHQQKQRENIIDPHIVQKNPIKR